jgi:hypothetical protein
MAQFYFLVVPQNGNPAVIVNALLAGPYRESMVSEVSQGEDKGNLFFTTGFIPGKTETAQKAAEGFLNGISGISYSVPDMDHLRQLAQHSKRIRRPLKAVRTPEEYASDLVPELLSREAGHGR